MFCREQNVVAIDLITQHIRVKLQQPDLRRIYHNLEVVPSNYQTRGMHTIIRDIQTNKADFVFYADRLLRLVRASAAAALHCLQLVISCSINQVLAWALSLCHVCKVFFMQREVVVAAQLQQCHICAVMSNI